MLKQKQIIMYFEVKAFRNGLRRFENLDNINELNQFVYDRIELGFNKFIIKSFDCNGYRKTRFCVVKDGDYTVTFIK